MKTFRKIIVWLLCICILLSSFALFVPASKTAYGATVSYKQYEDSADPTVDYPYYEFENIVDVRQNDDYIVVTQSLTENSETYIEYVVFDEKGNFYNTISPNNITYGDPQKIELFGNVAVSLNYYTDDSSMLYSVLLRDYAETEVGTTKNMLSDSEPHYIKDFAVAGDYVYSIRLSLNSKIIKSKLGSGSNVATTGVESVVNIDLSNFSAIEGCGDDILIQTEFSKLYHFDTLKEELTPLDNLPTEKILQFGGYDNDVFILTAKGLYHRDIDVENSEFKLVLAVSDKSSTEDNIVSPISFSTSKTGDTINVLIADGTGAMAIKRFSLSGGLMLSDMFSIYSFSSDKEGYNTPTGISSTHSSYVVCDSLNNRVKVIDDDGDIKIYETLDGDNKSYSPIYAGIDYSGNVFVISSDDELFVYTSSGNLESSFDKYDGSSFRRISGLEVSPYDNTCYFLDGSRVISYDHATKTLSCPVPIATSGAGIAIDYIGNNVGIIKSSSMDVFSLASGEEVFSVSRMNTIGSLQDVEFDLAGNFFALSSSENYSIVARYEIVDGEYSRTSTSVYNYNAGLTALSINFQEEMAYFLQDGVHRVFESNDLFDDLDVQYQLKTEIPLDIFEITEQEDVLILDVISDGNRLLLPAYSRDTYYPDGYAISRPMKLPKNSKVIVVGKAEDEDLYYVLYNNSVGFMHTDALESAEVEVAPPFSEGLALHENSYIYKYPLSTANNLVPLYGFEQLDKDTKLEIVNMANDYLCPKGLLWYRVEVTLDGETIVGYMPRYNVVEDADLTNPVYEYGRINAKLFEGYAPVYADEGITSLGKKLYDGTKVLIVAERNDYLYVMEAEPEGDTAIEGYVLKEAVTSDAQTRSFTIAVILVIVLVVVATIIIFVKIKLKKKNRGYRD